MNYTQNIEKRFVYFYLNRNEPEKIKQVVPAHVRYWKKANRTGFMGGQFGDRTGGLISFVAQSLQEAMDIILQEPFILEDSIEQKWIKE
jgi:uncharacterized protein YciI